MVKRYKALCREVIDERYLGHISHFAGDGVLAVFGLPTPHENDAERAVRAALDIVRELRVLSEEFEEAFAEHLDARLEGSQLLFAPRRAGQEDHVVFVQRAGLVPALQAGVVDVHETLKETGRGTTRRR